MSTALSVGNPSPSSSSANLPALNSPNQSAKPKNPDALSLPDDVLGLVFKYLDPASRQAVGKTHKILAHISNVTTAEEEVNPLLAFIRSLEECLDKQKRPNDTIEEQKNEFDMTPRQKQCLSKLTKLREKAINAVMLLALKKDIYNVKTSVLHFLQDLDPKLLDYLKSNPPKDATKAAFFNTLLELAVLYGRVVAAQSIPDKTRKSIRLRHICKALTQREDPNKAVAVAQSIPSKIGRFMTLRDISETLMAKGDIVKAVAVARSIPSELFQYSAFCDIFAALMTVDDLDKVVAASKSIPDVFDRSWAFYEISKALVERGDIDRAQAVTEQISHAYFRKDTLTNINKGVSANCCSIQ